MKNIPTIYSMNLEKQALFIIFTAIAVACVSMALVLASGLKAATIGTLLLLCLILSFKYPRTALWLFLIYLPFGGTITYLAPVYQAVGDKISFNTSLYAMFQVAKDAFYLPAAIALFFSTKFFQDLRTKNKPLSIALLALLTVCLLTLFFVNLPQPKGNAFLMGVIGLKVLLGYIPLIACAYYLIRDRQDLLFFTRLQVILILICCTLCLTQYLFLLTGICDGNTNLTGVAVKQATLQARCFVGGSLLYNPIKDLIRLPGTFVSPWQWGWFLISASFIAYAASVVESSRLWRIISWLAIGFILVATLISGQRIALLLVPCIFLLLLALTNKEKKWLPLKFGIIFLLGIILATQVGLVKEQIVGLIDRWNYSSPFKFTIEQFQWVLRNHLEILGNGLGKTASAARRFGNIKLIETFYAQLLYEIGVIGTIAFVGVVSVLTVSTFRAKQRLQDISLKHLAICLWVFIAFISYNTYYYPLMVDPVAVYYWFLAGILLKLPQIEIQQ